MTFRQGAEPRVCLLDRKFRFRDSERGSWDTNLEAVGSDVTGGSGRASGVRGGPELPGR